MRKRHGRGTPDGVRFLSSGNHPIALHLRASVPVRIEAAPRSPSSLCARTSRPRSCSSRCGRRGLSQRRARLRRGRLQAHRQLLAPVARSLLLPGRWREMVNRSALTLKLLTSRPHGSIVASPTFGLRGARGQRNWDYRYTWIRTPPSRSTASCASASTEEAAAFMRWVEARCEELEPDGSLQICTGSTVATGSPRKTCRTSRATCARRPCASATRRHQPPARHYGELMDAIYLYDKYGAPISYDLWSNVKPLHDWSATHWRDQDERSGRCAAGQEFLYSRVLCWAALDRAVRLAQKRFVPGFHWFAGTTCATRSTATSSPTSGPGAQGVSSRPRARPPLDAATLLMPLIRFISPTDPRWVSTFHAIEQDLSATPWSTAIGRDGSPTPLRQGGDLQHVLLLVRRVPLPHGRPRAGAVLLREDPRLREPPRAVRRAARPARRATRELPAGLHAPRAHQRRLRSRPAALGGGRSA